MRGVLDRRRSATYAVLIVFICAAALASPAYGQATLVVRIEPTPCELCRVHVSIERERPDCRGEQWHADIGSSGRHTFTELPSGEYIVHVDDPWYRVVTRRLQLRDAQTINIVLEEADPQNRCSEETPPYPCPKASGVVRLHMYNAALLDVPEASRDPSRPWLYRTLLLPTPFTLENADTGERYLGETDDRGQATVTDLPKGTYRIVVDRSTLYAPFRSAPFRVTGTPGYIPCCMLTALTYGPHETVTVNAPAAGAGTHADGSGGVVFSRDEIAKLPATLGRTVQSFQQLVPGLVLTDTMAGSLMQATAIGQPRGSNRMTIDGVEADLAVPLQFLGNAESASGGLPAYSSIGGTQTLVATDAIEEIQVRTTNATSSHARTPGAQTAIVTRAGGDHWKGSAFADGRSSSMTARDWFVKTGQVLPRRFEPRGMGASAGGPIARRLFGFGTWERQRIERLTTVSMPVPSTAARATAGPTLRPILEAFPQPTEPDQPTGLSAYRGKLPTASGFSAISLRTDVAASAQHRLFVRHNRGSSGGDAVGNSVLGQAPFKSFQYEEDASLHTTTAGLSSSIGRSTTHELRLNHSENAVSLTAGPSPRGYARELPLSDLATAGSFVRVNLFPGPDGFVMGGQAAQNATRQWHVLDSWMFDRGEHQWRTGVEYRRLSVRAQPAPRTVTYQFSGVASAIAGQRPQVFVDHALPLKARIERYAAYVEDTWRPSARLSMTYGVRYSVKPAPVNETGVPPLVFELADLPSLTARRSGELWPTRWTDVAPRVAAVYQLSQASGRELTIRTGWSLTFDDLSRPGLQVFARGYPYMWKSLAEDAAPASFESQGGEAFALQELTSPRVHQWQVGIDRAFGRTQRLAATYVGTASRRMPYQEAHFLEDPARSIIGYSSAARGDYHGLLAEYTRRLSNGWQARVAYTWSRSNDTDSGEAAKEFNPPSAVISPRTNYGRSDFDRSHVLQATMTYRTPSLSRFPAVIRATLADWQVDLVGMFRSGAPLTVLGVQTIAEGIYSMRPDLVPGIPAWINDPTSPIGKRLNPEAFRMPSEPRQGTLSRNSLKSSPLRQMDVAIARAVRVRGAQLRARLEIFNITNAANVGPPYTKLGAVFGRTFITYAESLGAGALAGGGLSPIQQIGGPRSCQLSLRVEF